jgi:diguanylate cyclase (GGDEF)-like protein/PAS domain S-box-containing protein
MQSLCLTAPELSALPGHWVRLDDTGRVLCADAALMEQLGRAMPHGGSAFASWLTPSSGVLWASALWPLLVSQRRLSEVLIELAPGPGAPADGWPALTSWVASNDDGVLSYVGQLMPGHERRRLLAELRQARESLESMPGALLQIDTGSNERWSFPYASNQLLDMFGVTPLQAQMAPARLLDALAADSLETLKTAVGMAQATGQDHWLVVLTPRRHPERRIELAARRTGHPTLWHGVLTDVSERESLQTELRERAETDALTRLPNRVALLAQVRRHLEAGLPFALLFMDCDRFKQINDSLGHDAGDELLRHLAQRLRHGLRPSDALMSVAPVGTASMAARLGGDEFVVLADGVTDRAAASAIADRLVSSMARPYKLRGMELAASVSVGVVMAEPGSTAEQLMRDADTAMYEAKRQGRGGWALFEPEMHQRVAGSLALEADLRQALRCGQIRAAYQPIIEISSGRVVGMEALARWQHPGRGEVPPAQFIPVAEESGLIVELGEQVLRLACTQFAAWRRERLALPARLSVNLSRAQLSDLNLPARLQHLLDECGLPCNALQLEVTESMAMDDASVPAALLGLRALGVQLALDDFGTGHSSLASLQNLPVQQVKIDRSFVREVETSIYHRALIQAALQVAHALSLEVVAEGVETAAQARLLSELGCTRAQGWLYAKALDPAAVPDFLGGSVARVLHEHHMGAATISAAVRGHQVVVTDPQGLTVHVNPAFTLNTGYTLEDMRGRSPGSVLQGPGTDPRAVRVLRDAVRTGVGCLGVEVLNYRKDGTPFHVLIDIEPVRDASGAIVQFLSVQSEISERKRNEEELAELRQRIDDVRSVGLVGFWERDLASGKAFADEHVHRMLGLPPGSEPLEWDELLRRVTPESRGAVERYVAEVSSGRLQGFVQYVITHPDGSQRGLQVHWSRRGDRLLGLMVDVTEQGLGAGLSERAA